MELKTFKAGVEFLARATNQRQAEPAPFLVQVGKDGRVSLVAGEGSAVYIWRTDTYQHALGRREGISSKLLVQTTKTLKGKELEVELHFDDNLKHLKITTSKGGVVKLPFIEGPEIRPPKFGGPEAHFTFKEGRLAELVKAIDATADGDTSRGVQFVLSEGRLAMIATEEHKAFVTYLDTSDMDQKLRTAHWGTGYPFWMPLRSLEGTASLTLFQTGLHVRSGDFEAYSGFSILPVFDLRQKYFPDGTRPEIYVVTDRKVLLGSIKSLTGDERNGTIDMAQSAEGGFFLSSGKEHIGMPRAKGKGWGRVGFSPVYMSDILNAMSGKEVILAWHEDATKPIGIKDAGRQGDTFLLAPRSQA